MPDMDVETLPSPTDENMLGVIGDLPLGIASPAALQRIFAGKGSHKNTTPEYNSTPPQQLQRTKSNAGSSVTMQTLPGMIHSQHRVSSMTRPAFTQAGPSFWLAMARTVKTCQGWTWDFKRQCSIAITFPVFIGARRTTGFTRWSIEPQRLEMSLLPRDSFRLRTTLRK